MDFFIFILHLDTLNDRGILKISQCIYKNCQAGTKFS